MGLAPCVHCDDIRSVGRLRDQDRATETMLSWRRQCVSILHDGLCLGESCYAVLSGYGSGRLSYDRAVIDAAHGVIEQIVVGRTS